VHVGGSEEGQYEGHISCVFGHGVVVIVIVAIVVGVAPAGVMAAAIVGNVVVGSTSFGDGVVASNVVVVVVTELIRHKFVEIHVGRCMLTKDLAEIGKAVTQWHTANAAVAVQISLNRVPRLLTLQLGKTGDGPRSGNGGQVFCVSRYGISVSSSGRSNSSIRSAIRLS